MEVLKERNCQILAAGIKTTQNILQVIQAPGITFGLFLYTM